MFDRETRVELGERFFKARDFTPIPLIFLLLLFGQPSVKSATLGLMLVVMGELWRIYSVGFIGGISRTRSESLGQRLVSEGAFAYMRNPLYVGNFLITLGFTLYSGRLWLTILTMLLFAVQYFFIVAYEENLLIAKFGEEYEAYMLRVPRWVPGHWPSLDQMIWPANFAAAIRSEKRTLTTIISLILLLALFS